MEKEQQLLAIGGSIKFFLLNWCEVNNDVKLVYKDTILDIKSPSLLKLTYRENKLINLQQIN